MTELAILGLGVWSNSFSNWDEFCAGVHSGRWQSESTLAPEVIPPRERRRAPESVKLAVEAMHQACTMAAIEPGALATVFSSAMGDMQITDYLCRTLCVPPRLVSPTRFHNSVHNAPVGYWSISTKSFAPGNAVSAYSYSASMAFLEAAIQVSEEGTPVLLVMQEMAAPEPLFETCPSEQPYSSSMILAPMNYSASHLASVRFSVSQKAVDRPGLPADLQDNLDGNFGAMLLPLLREIAQKGKVSKHSDQAGQLNKSAMPTSFEFPLTSRLCLNLSVVI